jgi:TPR repeat protein
MYRFGKGLAVDVGRAYEYYEKAADLGHLFARRAMAQRMIRGDYGVWRVPLGLLKMVKIAWDAFKLYLKNPSDDRLRRLA